MHVHDGCEHHAAPANYNHAFALGVTLNLSFVVAELVYGAANRSLSLLADAGHNLGDVLGLLMGWVASIVATRPATIRRTYGYRRTTILASVGNSAILLVGVGAIAWEAIQRLSEPVTVPGTTVMAVAAVGILINGGTALAFVRGRKNDINLEGAYTHMVADAFIALGVVIGGIVMHATGMPWIDPVMALLISATIMIGSWRLLRRSVDMAIDAVPEKLDPIAVRAYLEALPGVETVTDLHIWSLSTTQVALTAHLVVPADPGPELIEQVEHELVHRFQIHHTTIQVDRVARECALEV